MSICKNYNPLLLRRYNLKFVVASAFDAFRLPVRLIAALDKLSETGSPEIKDRNRNQITKIALERLVASEKKHGQLYT